MFFILSQKALAFTFLQTFFHRLLSPPTPYTALLSLLSVALSSVTAKSNFMILPDACCVNIQPARKACSISAESVLNFAGLAAQSLRRTHYFTVIHLDTLFQSFKTSLLWQTKFVTTPEIRPAKK